MIGDNAFRNGGQRFRAFLVADHQDRLIRIDFDALGRVFKHQRLGDLDFDEMGRFGHTVGRIIDHHIDLASHFLWNPTQHSVGFSAGKVLCVIKDMVALSIGETTLFNLIHNRITNNLQLTIGIRHQNALFNMRNLVLRKLFCPKVVPRRIVNRHQASHIVSRIGLHPKVQFCRFRAKDHNRMYITNFTVAIPAFSAFTGTAHFVNNVMRIHLNWNRVTTQVEGHAVAFEQLVRQDRRETFIEVMLGHNLPGHRVDAHRHRPGLSVSAQQGLKQLLVEGL